MTTPTEMPNTLAEDRSFKFPDGPYPRPFEVKILEPFLDMTLRKVRDFRPTFGLSPSWSLEGPPHQDINRIAKTWGSEYNWRSVEQQINDEFKHYATVVPGSGNYNLPIPLHFVHHVSGNGDAIPLLLLHGWPSSSLEWSKVIKPLSEDATRSFHVVAPDLPGFGFSPAPRQPGMGPREMGRAFDILMKQLGYDKYGIATTDLGWTVGMWMVHDVQDSIIGHMCDFFMVPPNEDDQARMQAGTMTTEESDYMSSMSTWFASHSAYSTAHSQKPLALSLALGDSPVGLLGWCWDLIHTVSDGYPYSEKELITDTMMLWIPGPYANIRSYLEFYKVREANTPSEDPTEPGLIHQQPENMNFSRSNVPTGISQWGWGRLPFPSVAKFPFVPVEWLKRMVNLSFFTRHEGGGHFPAINEPGLWVQDVQSFFYRSTSD